MHEMDELFLKLKKKNRINVDKTKIKIPIWDILKRE